MSHDAPVTVADLTGLSLSALVELFRQLQDEQLSKVQQAADLAYRLKDAAEVQRAIWEYLA